MKKLKILLYADSYNDRISQGADYITFLEAHGKVTLLTTSNAEPELIPLYDVLCLPGGADVDPARYGEIPQPECGRTNTQYEWLDLNFLPAWIASGKPIIGICRGAQTLNVALGGSLVQHLTGHTGKENRYEDHHEVFTEFDDIDGDDYRIYGTNSYHHQGVKRVADELKVIGWSHLDDRCPSVRRNRDQLYIGSRFIQHKGKEPVRAVKADGKTPKLYFGVPEILIGKEKPYIAFQYHPENMECPLAHALIDRTLSQYYPEYTA